MEVRDGAGEGHQQDTTAAAHGGDIVEGVTDGHIVIKGHGCQKVVTNVTKGIYKYIWVRHPA